MWWVPRLFINLVAWLADLAKSRSFATLRMTIFSAEKLRNTLQGLPAARAEVLTVQAVKRKTKAATFFTSTWTVAGIWKDEILV